MDLAMGQKNLPTQDEINSFVGVAHGDFDTVKRMLEANPALLSCNAS